MSPSVCLNLISLGENGTYSRRPDDSDDERRWLLGGSVHQRDMEALFSNLGYLSTYTYRTIL
jgi:hypothetical protein